MISKIDSRSTFRIITPDTQELDSVLEQEIKSLSTASIQDGQSVILDFSSIRVHSLDSLSFLQQLHHDFYYNSLSFVITQASDTIKTALKDYVEEDSINLTPTLAEAIDIVAMEDVERELLGGE